MTTAAGVSFYGSGNSAGQWTTLLDLVYPVGSVYLTKKTKGSFQPANYFGGDWETIESGACLRTNVTGASGYVPIGKQGSDTHFHNVAGPEDEFKSSNINRNVGVRTSISFGGYQDIAGEAWGHEKVNILWARYIPSYCGTKNNHPGFNEFQGKGGFSYITTATNNFKFNTGDTDPEGITDTQGSVGTVAGCFGWTRGNTQYNTNKTWDNDGKDNDSIAGDGTAPVAYTLVTTWYRRS